MGSPENLSVVPAGDTPSRTFSAYTDPLKPCTLGSTSMQTGTVPYTDPMGRSPVLQITVLISACQSKLRCLTVVSSLCEDKQCYWCWKLVLPKRIWTLGSQVAEYWCEKPIWSPMIDGQLSQEKHPGALTLSPCCLPSSATALLKVFYCLCLSGHVKKA